ncbi:MAG: hypothetical protein ABSD74_06260 [Rhizomicrobium sp.]
MRARQTSQSPAPPGRPGDVHNAASTQRDHAVNSFESQRSAILKAVDEQREAALAPIRAVQVRQGAHVPGQPPQTPTNSADPGQGAPLNPHQLVALEIVAHLKALIAEEVRSQLLLLLEAATLKHGQSS